jgi:hypothetical protein
MKKLTAILNALASISINTTTTDAHGVVKEKHETKLVLPPTPAPEVKEVKKISKPEGWKWVFTSRKKDEPRILFRNFNPVEMTWDEVTISSAGYRSPVRHCRCTDWRGDLDRVGDSMMLSIIDNGKEGHQATLRMSHDSYWRMILEQLDSHAGEPAADEKIHYINTWIQHLNQVAARFEEERTKKIQEREARYAGPDVLADIAVKPLGNSLN